MLALPLSLSDIGLWILVGIVVGWLAALTDRGGDEGVLRDVAVGVIGACVGGIATYWLPVTSRSPVLLTIATAMIGAAALLALVRAFTTARWTR
jgi:uncharacterized membrane protein YeaQ/YmgE (transglycosylase-associated protein family)